MLLPIALLWVTSFLTSAPGEVAAAHLFLPGSGFFKVTDYSALKNGLSTGDYIQSMPFTVGDNEWVIEFYPQGYSARFKKSVAVMVRLINAESEVQAMFTHSLYDWKTGNWSHPRPASNKVETFSPYWPPYRGFYDFIERSTLDTSNYLGKGNDTLLIRTTLWILLGNTTATNSDARPTRDED